jgi:formamidopyrimidine-DNA glycosylase
VELNKLSVELPEAVILAEQMTKTLVDKKINSCEMQDYEKLQKVGFFNKDLKKFNSLIGCKITSIMQRGNVIRIKMNKKMNLILCPDYGANVFYHKSEETLPKKYHLKVGFTDGSFLTIRQTGMGLIYSAEDQEVSNLYVIKRDFSDTPSPLGEHQFTFERFKELLESKNQNIKGAIVGKTAVVVGLSNAAFQEIIYRAGIHPKRNTSTLTDSEKHNVYDAMKEILNARVCSGGKDNWTNLFGEPGRHVPVMGSNMKDKDCPECGAKIEKMSHGGGQVYFCPRCQK